MTQLFDEATLEPLKEYKTERPVNSAAISSLRVRAVPLHRRAPTCVYHLSTVMH